jgi:predicted HTH domain antitoxin
MPVVIPDEVLREAGLSERAALIEIACRLFQGEMLSLAQASRLAGLGRSEFEYELITRRIPIYFPTAERIDEEMAAMDRLGIPG